MNSLPTGSRIYYSLKSNPHPSIIKHLLNLGAKAEVSSINELQVALKAGARADECLYTGPGKTEKEVRFAIMHDVKWFSIESWTDAERLSRLCELHQRQVNAIIRINPSKPANQVGLSMSGIASQFGIDEEGLDCIPDHICKNHWLTISGLHIYQSTNLMNSKDVESNLKYSIRIMARICARLGIRPELLDIGGGFGCPFAKAGPRPDFSSIKPSLEQVLDEVFPQWRKGDPQIAFESGRYLTGESGTLITTVTDVKTSKNQTFIIVDTGIHHLGGMSALGRIPKVAVQMLEYPKHRLYKNATVVGPLCTPLDYLLREVSLPEAQPGDHYLIPNVGAYALTASLMGFLSRENPVEIVMYKGRILDVSRIVLSRTEGNYN